MREGEDDEDAKPVQLAASQAHAGTRGRQCYRATGSVKLRHWTARRPSVRRYEQDEWNYSAVVTPTLLLKGVLLVMGRNDVTTVTVG